MSINSYVLQKTYRKSKIFARTYLICDKKTTISFLNQQGVSVYPTARRSNSYHFIEEN